MAPTHDRSYKVTSFSVYTTIKGRSAYREYDQSTVGSVILVKSSKATDDLSVYLSQGFMVLF